MAERPFIPIPFGIEVALKAHAAAKMSPAVMTFGFLAANAAPDTGDIAAVATMFGNWLTTAYGGIPADSVFFDEFVVSSLATRLGPILPVSVGGFASGGTGRFAVFAPLTLNRTEFRGRSYNGRSFSFMPPDDSLGDNGEFDPAYIATIESSMNTLRTNAATAVYPYAVPSRLNRAMTNIASVHTQLKYAYQTRRDPNRG